MLPIFPSSPTSPRYLFLDMNSFYCSIEQQECPGYRDKPVIVVPILTDNTCVIAASYEAKARGIRTGSRVGFVKSTPGLQIVEARPEVYLAYHARLVNLLNEHFVTVKVFSVDEMACKVPQRLYKTAYQEEVLAKKLKAQMARELGSCLRCSIGIAPNIFLAKVAAERQKPDGLTIWNGDNLPEALFELKLSNLPGIGPAMQRRLKEYGVGSVEDLWYCTPSDLKQVWKSVLGERWWWMLRGSQEADYAPMQSSDKPKKSVGHSNVLAPEHRSKEGACRILLELFAKALKRLRAYDLAATAVQVTVRYRKPRGGNGASQPFPSSDGVWSKRSRRHLPAHDETTWLKVLRPLLEAVPDLSPTAAPIYVGIVFSELLLVQDVNLSLFPEDDPLEKMKLARLKDALNQKYGHTLDVAALYKLQKQVPLRIPFGPPDTRQHAEETAEG